MITMDSSNAVKQLEAFEKEMIKRLENMVQGFATEVGERAVDNTPLGDAVKFADLYARRFRTLGLEPIEGFAQGSWRYANNSTDQQQDYYSGDWAKGDIAADAESYKLGDDFYIINSGPYIRLLNSKGFITEPTINQVEAVYRSDLQRYYKEG